MRIDIITLFPEMCQAVLNESIIGRAVAKGAVEIVYHQLRDYAYDRHKRVDDTPYGGGMGMVMKCEPIALCFEAVCNELGKKPHFIYMSPVGRVLNQSVVKQIASGYDNICILCGHYEGVDQRVLDMLIDEEISIGDYVLTGGELPAMVLIDSVARLLPDVLGNENSALEESVYSGLLEHPQYTKPREYRGLRVPEVLLNGNHKLIDLWKFRQALLLTKERRPDMFRDFIGQEHELSKDERKVLEEIMKIEG